LVIWEFFFCPVFHVDRSKTSWLNWVKKKPQWEKSLEIVALYRCNTNIVICARIDSEHWFFVVHPVYFEIVNLFTHTPIRHKHKIIRGMYIISIVITRFVQDKWWHRYFTGRANVESCACKNYMVRTWFPLTSLSDLISSQKSSRNVYYEDSQLFQEYIQ
jgi:hypothetical protein